VPCVIAVLCCAELVGLVAMQVNGDTDERVSGGVHRIERDCQTDLVSRSQRGHSDWIDREF